MAIDLELYRRTRLSPRTAELRFPEMALLCAPGAEPVFTVRALTGEEIARANEANDRLARTKAAIEAMIAGGTVRREAFADLLLGSDATPEDLAKRIEHALVGVVDPALDRELVLRLFADFPVCLFALTNKILELTGLGADVGKALGSGPTPVSEPA